MSNQSMPFAHPMMVPGAHFVPGFGTQHPIPQHHPMHQHQAMHQHPPMQQHQPMHEQADQAVEDDIEGQHEDEDDVEEVTASQFTENEGRKKGASHRGSGFIVEEDRVIVSGWLNVSKDATTGNIQLLVLMFLSETICYDSTDLKCL